MASEITNEIITDAFNGTAQALSSLFKLMDDLARDRETKQSVVINDKKMVQKLVEYQKNGGTLVSDDIGADFSNIYEQLLKNKGVPFVSSTIVDRETGEKRVIFSTRDKDALAVSLIRDQFKHELQYGLGEIDPNRFLEVNAYQDVYSISNLTAVEKEILQHNLVDSKITYAFDYDTKTNKYTVLCGNRDAESMNTALKLTAYDLAGNKGQSIKQEIEKELEQRKRFEFNITPVEKQSIYIVDAANPANFIAVSKDSYSYHSLHLQKTELEDGSINVEIKDMFDGKDRAYNKAQVLRLADGLIQKPVVLSEEEMRLVSSIDTHGNIKIADSFEQNYKELKKDLALRKDDLKHKKPIEEILKKDEVYGLENVPTNKINEISKEIENQNLKHTSVVGNQIAYTLEDKEIVEKIVNNALYSDLSKIKQFELRCKIEDRGEIDIDSGNSYLIKDMQNPGFQFKLDKDRFIIYNLREKENGIKVDPIVISRDSKQFEETVIPLLEVMQDPVILNADEMVLPYQARERIEIERKGCAKAEQARENLIDNSDLERSNLLKPEFKLEEATKIQKEALSKYETHWPKQTYKVDRTFTEKIADHTIEQKTVNERAKVETRERDYRDR